MGSNFHESLEKLHNLRKLDLRIQNFMHKTSANRNLPQADTSRKHTIGHVPIASNKHSNFSLP